MKKGEILLVAVLVVFGLVYHAVEKGKARLADDFSFYAQERNLKGVRFVEFPEPEKTFPSVARLRIENPAGEIVVERSDDERVHLSSSLRIYYTDVKDVDGIRKRLTIRSRPGDRELSVSVQSQSSFPYHWARVHMRLRVPPQTELFVSNREGNTAIKNTGKKVQVVQAGGHLMLWNIASDLELRLENCNADIKGVGGHAEIHASRSNVMLQDALSLLFKGRHGLCSVKGIRQGVVIDHSYGKVELENIDKVELIANQGTIIARNISSGMKVSNRLGSTLLENVRGDTRVSSRLGKVIAHHAGGGNFVIENAFGDIEVSDFFGENLDLLLKSGNLDLRVGEATNRVNVESRYSQVHLAVDASADPAVNIKTRHGRIYGGAFQGLEEFQSGAESFANRDGHKPTILVNNTYGSVHLKSVP
ncbi:MAG: DUF4097 family beta strand repeat protein [Candidatus Aminicenantes bacterium]|nr:DUF4097 family beta strand repeat protein [Candidatus Aminicenantes bacterium]